MKHGRADYERIQDPAAEPGIYEFLGQLADACEARQVQAVTERVAKFFRVAMDGMPSAEEAAMLARAREFAARPLLLAAGCAPIGEDEPVFLIRGRDLAAGPALRGTARRRRKSTEEVTDGL